MELLNLSKEESDQLLDLRKDNVQMLCLKKDGLNGAKARVALVLDYSGSMKPQYKDGTVQAIIDRMLPIAMQFDDNGEMEVWIFEGGFHRLTPISMANYYGYVEREIMGKYEMGGTKYAPVIRDIKKAYIDEDCMPIANYVIFVTDGDAQDKEQAEQAIKDVSVYPIFLQFVGIKGQSYGFEFLKKLDDMGGRYVDNANFFHVPDINAISDDDIYDKLLDEFPSWLSDPKVKEMIQNPGNPPSLPKSKGGFFSRMFG